MLSEINQRETNTVFYHLYVESKKLDKWQKQTHRYREQTSGYHQAEKREEGQDRDKGLEAQNTMYKINRLHGYIVQHREYSQYFIALNLA